MSTPRTYTSIGGQAVIEGVMMRSPNYVAIAVRKPDGKIIIKYEPHRTLSSRFPWLGKPVLRGVVTLVESMVLGMRALSFSAEIGDEKQGEKPLTRKEVIGSMVFAFGMAMALFVALPHLLTVLLTSERFLGIAASSPLFHLLDGLFKMGILVLYITTIARIPEIQRVFQYHGAEHQSIYAFEADQELTVENASRHTTLHPRCGTSFLLFLVLISVLMFSVILPVFGLTAVTGSFLADHLIMILAKIFLMLPVAGVAYEVIKMSARHMENVFFRMLSAPGLWLQNLTTRVPDPLQLEVALVSLRQVLHLEKNPEGARWGKVEISGLSDIHLKSADVMEFLEA